MEQTIKPIETIYNGYRFRSRLEARWAVFYGKLIPYEYEKEGFWIDGKPYLPDFYLPWFDVYVEIKPKNYEHIKETKEMLEKLAIQLDRPTILCVGDPLDDEMWICCSESDDGGGGGPLWFRCWFVEGAEVENSYGCWGMSRHWVSIAIGIHGIGGSDREREYWTPSFSKMISTGNFMQAEQITQFRSRLEEYRIKARQARFEHGEKP